MSNLNKLAWNNVDWKKVESRVFRMQRRIYKAKSKNRPDTVHYLQNKLLHSFDAKLLSLRKVSKRQESIALVNKLRFKRIVTKTSKVKNKKVKNNLFNISTILEKAKETLIKSVIEPEWEVLFSTNCCGGRPGYKYQDAILKVLKSIDSKPIYVLTIDLSPSFNKFNYEKLLKKLNTTKRIKDYICYWLELNFMKQFFQNSRTNFEIQNKKIFKSNTIAPLLCNITLYGLETHLMKFNSSLFKKEDMFTELNYIQYLDKILISNPNKKVLEKVREIVLTWLSAEGINCIQNQFSIKKATEGFQFLGFHIIVLKKRNKYITKTHISKESKNALLKKTRITIQKNKSASAYKLINDLVPTLIDWKNYFIHSDCSADFKQMDNRLFNQLRAWVFRRKANGKNRHFLKEKYFPKEKKYMYENKIHTNNWILYGKTKTESGKTYENYLPKLTWSKPKYYVRIEKKTSLYT